MHSSSSSTCAATTSHCATASACWICRSRETGARHGDAVRRKPLGVQGRALPGGERQRIALGRALATRPSVVILDEPTSSLDGAREARIFARLRQRVPTLVVMTHHHSLLKVADRAYRVEHGTVREFVPLS
ncbi:ATP-binding cassette domain-containing protein [Burkholderia ubonensis]|uniref:ATP-binding cassette domain-containing protein n=1 Tax=Burkholderia ubonensis TaxID=101571 RepID=UPI0009B387CC